MRPLTRSCFLLLVLRRLFLLALLSFLESGFLNCGVDLFSSCSRSDLPLSRQGSALAHLDSPPSRSGALDRRLCPFGKGGSGVLANCSLSGTESSLFISTGQYVQVFRLKPEPFCTLFADLGRTSMSATSLVISYCLTLVLSSPPCPLLHLSSYPKLCGRSGRNCLLSPSVLSSYNWSPDTHFSRGITRLMTWPDGERYLRPPQPFVVTLFSLESPLLSYHGLEAYCFI